MSKETITPKIEKKLEKAQALRNQSFELVREALSEALARFATTQERIVKVPVFESVEDLSVIAGGLRTLASAVYPRKFIEVASKENAIVFSRQVSEEKAEAADEPEEKSDGDKDEL